MSLKLCLAFSWALLVVVFNAHAFGASKSFVSDIHLEVLGTYSSDIFDGSAAEIGAYDSNTRRVFVTNAADNALDVLDISDPTALFWIKSIDLSPYGVGPNSVAVKKGLVAVAVESDPKQDPGSVVFFDSDGDYLNLVTVGALPDMLTFTPNGHRVLVANEGEPSDDYRIDPEGSVSIIKLPRDIKELNQDDVSTVDFQAFNNAKLDPRIRIYGPGATVAEDLEPEYIAVSKDSKTAWVTLQENNALAIIDIHRNKVVDLVALGTKDHRFRHNALDASDKDDGIQLRGWPVEGMYQPDAIATYQFLGRTYLVTANEGDARDYAGFSEEARVADLSLDTAAFPNAAELQLEENLGRIKTTTVNGDKNNDGLFEQIFAYGARSFSIWTSKGKRVFDSGADFERLTARLLSDDFNSTNDENGTFDNRSDDKGPEPEALTVGNIRGRIYAFIGLERIGAIMVYDITFPFAPTFVKYVNNRDFSGDPEEGTAGDLGPGGIVFIPESKSPIRHPLLVVTNEVSGTTTLYKITQR